MTYGCVDDRGSQWLYSPLAVAVELRICVCRFTLPSPPAVANGKGAHDLFSTSRVQTLTTITDLDSSYWSFLEAQVFKYEGRACLEASDCPASSACRRCPFHCAGCVVLCTVTTLSNSFQQLTQLVQMVPFPSSSWTPSPPELTDLLATLQAAANGTDVVTASLTVVRCLCRVFDEPGGGVGIGARYARYTVRVARYAVSPLQSCLSLGAVALSHSRFTRSFIVPAHRPSKSLPPCTPWP